MALATEIGILRINFDVALGPVFTVSELCPEIPAGFLENQSFDDSELNYPDPFTSTEPIDLREGPCGGNWHTRIWKDTDTDQELGWIPGDPNHTEDSVDVQNTDMVISDRPVTLQSANLSGTLEVNQPFTLRENSRIESLQLNADLETNGELKLTGNSKWKEGRIFGEGSVNQVTGIFELQIEPEEESVDLEIGLMIKSKMVHKSGTLNLADQDSVITIENDGVYEITAGTLVDSVEGQYITNHGIFLKTGNSTATINALFDNGPFGIIEAKEGRLSFKDDSIWSGAINVSEGATIDFTSTTIDLTQVVPSRASGDGKLVFDNSEIILGEFPLRLHLSKGTVQTKDLDLFFDSEGGVTINEGAHIYGSGSYWNMGLTFMNGGTIETDILNYDDSDEDAIPGDKHLYRGGFAVDGGTIKGNIENLEIFDFSGDLLQGNIKNAPSSDFYLFNGTIESEITNEGKLYLANADGGQPLNVEMVTISNSGTLIKDGSTPLTLKSLSNTGTVDIRNGKLLFTDNLTLIGSDLNVAFDSGIGTGTTVDIEGESSFKGEGAILLASSTIKVKDGAKLWNQTDTNGEGVIISNDSILLGTGVQENPELVGQFINQGKVHFQSGFLSALKVINSNDGPPATFFFEDAPLEENDTRVINTLFINNHRVEQSATVGLGFEAQVENNHIWKLWDGARLEIFEVNSGQKFENMRGGTLIKQGEGNAIIGVPLSNDGNISVDGGSLTLTGGAVFNTDLNRDIDITLRNGSEFHLESPTEIFDYRFEGRTRVLGEDGGGTLVINAPTTVSLKDLVVNTNTEWRSGQIFLDSADLRIVRDKSTPVFHIAGSEKSITGRGDLFVKPGASVVQDANLIINENVDLEIEGIWILGGDISLEEPIKSLGKFDIDGKLVSKAGQNNQVNVSLRIDKDSEVSVEEEGTLKVPTVFTFLSISLEKIISDAGTFLSGTWSLSPNSRIEIMDDRAIFSLGRDCKVDLAVDSSLNNLPNVEGNFLIADGALLILRNSIFSTSENLLLAGRIDAFDSKLIVGENLVIQSEIGKKSSLLAGDMDISVGGKVLNWDWTSPGLSPGTIIVNGDFQQMDTGTLFIEIGGTTPDTEHDQLIVNGTAELGGTLMLSSINGYELTEDVPITAVRATTIQGAFDQVVYGNSSSRVIGNANIVGEELQVNSSTIAPASFGEWRGAHFSDSNLLDETISGPLADPDLDGTGNFLEYVFDYVPQFADAQEPIFDIQLNEAGDKLLIGVIFPWAKGMTDVEYTLQTSLNLETWTDLESTVTETVEGEFIDLITLTTEVDSGGNIPLYGRLLVIEIEL